MSPSGEQDSCRLTGPSAGPVPGLFALALVLPFYVNDFLYMHAETYGQWLAADYGVRLLVLALAGWALWRGVTTPAALRLARCRAGWGRMAAWAAGLAVLGTALDQVGFDLAAALPMSQGLFDYPAPPGGAAGRILELVDLGPGLVLVALSEELVFRGAAHTWLRSRLGGRTGAVAALVLASAAFAGIHWSHGADALAVTFLVGLLLQWGTNRVGTLWPAVAAHYVVNLVDFAGWL